MSVAWLEPRGYLRAIASCTDDAFPLWRATAADAPARPASSSITAGVLFDYIYPAEALRASIRHTAKSKDG